MHDFNTAPLAQQSTSSDYKQLTNQPNINELDADFSMNLPPTADDILNNSAITHEAGLLLKNFLIFAEQSTFFKRTVHPLIYFQIQYHHHQQRIQIN